MNYKTLFLVYSCYNKYMDDAKCTELQNRARAIWESKMPTKVMYCQMTERDGSEWRVSDRHAGILGYVEIATESVRAYGASASKIVFAGSSVGEVTL